MVIIVANDDKAMLGMRNSPVQLCKPGLLEPLESCAVIFIMAPCMVPILKM